MLPKPWLQEKQAGVHRRKTASGLQEARTQKALAAALKPPPSVSRARALGAGPVSRLRPYYNMVGPETGRADNVAATAPAYLTLHSAPATLPEPHGCPGASEINLGPGRLWGMWRNRLLPKNKMDEKCRKRKEGRGRKRKGGRKGGRGGTVWDSTVLGRKGHSCHA